MRSDVMIIGGSVAGCTAAMLFAEAGLTVTVIEKKTNVSGYKKLCTHFIQPSALAVIRRLGLDTVIEEAGGLPAKADIWTHAGWIRSANAYSAEQDKTHGYNIPRQILDPLLKKRLGKYPNIHYCPGIEIRSVSYVPGNIEKVQKLTGLDTTGKEITLEAKLFVASDGRASKMAGLVNNSGHSLPNHRFACFAYYKGVPLLSGAHSQFWMLNPDMAFAYPHSNDITLLSIYKHKKDWPEWKKDLEGHFLSMTRQLPDGPDINEGRRISPIYPVLEMSNIFRNPVKDAIAFIGDAAMALDPMSGVGCAFAFQSAEWLADFTTQALLQDEDPGPSLRAYAGFHHQQLSAHASGISAESMAIPDNQGKLSFYRHIVEDPILTDAFLALTGRLISPQSFQSTYINRYLSLKKIPAHE